MKGLRGCESGPGQMALGLPDPGPTCVVSVDPTAAHRPDRGPVGIPTGLQRLPAGLAQGVINPRAIAFATTSVRLAAASFWQRLLT